ncbi:hypothetical protein HDV06_001300 [Boothiomyces sp. JEL0866]|nr:hypothetical protein HDV06_001300 [Boothiomyces sp. JEL0866]
MSDTVFLSGWMDSKFCTGPPDTMFVFSTINGSVSNLYNFEDQDYYIPSCGLSTFDLQTGCCLSSIDLAYTYGYKSFTRNYLVDSIIQHSAPISANTNHYCMINNLNSNSSLWGYDQVYFFAEGKCLEGNVTCEDGAFKIYNDSSCATILESFPISSKTINITSNIIGQVEIALIKYGDGQIPMTFTAYTPSWEMYLDFSETIDYWVLLVFLISSTMAFATGSYYTYYSIKTRKKRYILFAITQNLWMIRELMDLLNYYCPTTIPQWAIDFIFLIGSWAALASLFSVMISILLIFDMYLAIKPIHKYLIIFGVTLVHFGLEGFHYLGHTLLFCYLVTHNPDYNSLGYEIDILGQLPNSIWIFLQFLIELVPPVIIISKVVANKNTKHLHFKGQSREHLDKQIKVILALFCAQFANMIIFGVLDITLNTTNMFNSDRMYVLGLALTYQSLSINSCLVLAVYENLIAYLRLIVKKDVKCQVKDATDGIDSTKICERKIEVSATTDLDVTKTSLL